MTNPTQPAAAEIEKEAREFINMFAHHEAWQVSTINIPAIAQMMAEFALCREREAVRSDVAKCEEMGAFGVAAVIRKLHPEHFKED